MHRLHHGKLTFGPPRVLKCFINNEIDGAVKNYGHDFYGTWIAEEMNVTMIWVERFYCFKM